MTTQKLLDFNLLRQRKIENNNNNNNNNNIDALMMMVCILFINIILEQ